MMLESRRGNGREILSVTYRGLLGGAIALAAGLGISLGSPAQAADFALFCSNTISQSFSVQRVIAINTATSNTAPAPRPLQIPAAAIATTGMAFRAFPSVPTVAQFVETFSSSNPIAQTFVAGGGPGSFGFCPRAGNPVNPNCLVPSSGTGGRNGLLTYTADPGGTQFGGTFDLMRVTTGTVSRVVATAPLQHNHAPNFRSGNYIAGYPASQTRTYPMNPPGQVTQSPVLGPDGSIVTAGPVVGTAPAPGTLTATGFPFTTGMIVHNISAPLVRTFTRTGSDNRTASGYGAITLVAGSTQISATSIDFPAFSAIAVTLPEPASAPALVIGTMLLLSFSTSRSRRVRSNR
jgi:hypothetical protein